MTLREPTLPQPFDVVIDATAAATIRHESAYDAGYATPRRRACQQPVRHSHIIISRRRHVKMRRPLLVTATTEGHAYVTWSMA